MKVEKRKLQIFLTALLIIMLEENLFYLSSRNTIFILSIIGAGLLIYKSPHIVKNKYVWKCFLILWMVTICYGILLAKLYYGQSIIVGLYGNHYIFMSGWYFFFVDLLRGKKENTEYLVSTLEKMGAILVLLVIIQGILGQKVQILNLGYSERSGLRIGGCNIATPTLLLTLADEIRKHKVDKVLIIIEVTTYLFFFAKSRSLMLLVVVCMVLMYYKHLKLRKFVLKKSEILVLFSIGMVSAIGVAPYVLKILKELFFELTSISGTGGVRTQEIFYYTKLLKEHSFLGIGALAEQFPMTKYIYRTIDYLFTEDIGMLSIFFKTGFCGLILTIFLFNKLRKLIKSSERGSLQRYLCTCWMVMITVGFFTIQILDSKYMIIYFLLHMSIAEKEWTSQQNDRIRGEKLKYYDNF